MEFGRKAVAEHLVKNNMPRFKDWELDLSGAIDGMMDFNAELDKISKDIQKRKDNAMAMAFTKDIGDLLKKNGVCPKFEEYSDRVMGETKIEMRYGVCLVALDFSEHDKPFEDKISKLENRVRELEMIHAIKIDEVRKLTMEISELKSELESKIKDDLPFDALETANYLINATYERETSGLERAFAKMPDKVNDDRYTVDELEQIAEHLLVYCKHNKGCEE